jgi:hypothetical protein
MKRWNYIQTFVTIFHLFFGAWVYVVAGWAHMETGPYACPLKTPLMQMVKDLQIHKMTAVGPMQGKS